MSQRYVVDADERRRRSRGSIPLVDDETLRGIYDSLDGVFLPGGADIDPVSYGEAPHPLCDKTDRERDRVELALARWALADGKPVLGVCRGMQLINVAAGGTLYQDIAEQMPGVDQARLLPVRRREPSRATFSRTMSTSCRGRGSPRCSAPGALRGEQHASPGRSRDRRAGWRRPPWRRMA